MKKVCLSILTLLFYFHFSGQEAGYHINMQLDGYQDNIAYLGNYFGDKLAISDTAVVDKGMLEFSGGKPLKQGVYFLVSLQKKKLFEFMVGDDQYFEITRDLMDSPGKAQFTGSDENELFYAYLDYNRASYIKIRKLRSEIQTLPEGNDSLVILQAEMDEINKESIAYKLQVIQEHPNSVTAMLFNVMREPEVPGYFNTGGRHDSLSAYLYYRNHYWEYVDLGDDRFLRTPVFHKKLERYMNDVLPGHPDSLINEIDVMIAKTGEKSEMRNYLLWYFTNTYETSKVMSYDKIFVHMVDTYFTEQSYDWLNPIVQQNMINRVNQMRNVLIGAYAPALVMADTANKLISLHEVEAQYIILFFWSSSCGECQKEVETVNEQYKNTDIDMKIYAVNTDTVFSKWKNYISKHELDWINVNGNISLTGDYHRLYDIYSTPVIYLLDEQKTIIAKRLSADKLPAVISRNRKEKTK